MDAKMMCLPLADVLTYRTEILPLEDRAIKQTNLQNTQTEGEGDAANDGQSLRTRC